MNLDEAIYIIGTYVCSLKVISKSMFRLVITVYCDLNAY